MARQTKGRIYKTGKKGAFHLQYYVNGKEFKITLKDEAGEIVTNEKSARVAADKILHPVKAANRLEQLRQIQEAVENAEEKAKRLTDAENERRRRDEAQAQRERAIVSDGWKMFMECPKRPASCRRYSASEAPPHTTAANYLAYYRRFTEWLDGLPEAPRVLAEITPEIAARFMNEVRRSGAAGTFNKYLQFFNCFFDTLTEAGKIASGNPFRDIYREQPEYNSKKPLTVEQIKNLLDASGDELRVLIALGYFTGLRLGDCCTLQWREVDLIRGVIERIPRKTARTVKDKAQSVVKVGIAPYLRGLLGSIDRGAGVYVVPGMAAEYLNGGAPKLSRKVMNLFAQCGIQTRRAGTGAKMEYNEKTGQNINIGRRAVVEIGFHSLRYSYISHNAEAGTPAAIIQRNAGHSNPAMTEHYTRISDKKAIEYAAVLQLPCEAPAEIAPERAALHRLADELPIVEIRAILSKFHN